MDPVTGGGGGGGYSYPDSASSSPRSRSADSYDEPFPSPSSNPNSGSKVRLMCSYGGRIVPRPTDKSLTYLGGDTRFLLVDRHSSLSDLLSKLLSSISTSTARSSSNNNRNAELSASSFVIKYQLPSEDLDSLITLSSDEDLDHMIEEYDRINSSASSAAKSSRIRLFLFPTGKAESATSSSIGSLLDDSKSETWFVDALNNGAMAVGAVAGSGSADLLGLEAGGDQTDADRGMTRPDSSGRLETNSSFGSNASGPVMSNLPPIRVRAVERPPPPSDRRYEYTDDQFQKMNLGSGVKNAPPATTAANPMISADENQYQNSNSNRVGGFNDERPDTRRNQQALPHQMVNQQQNPPPPVEAAMSDSGPVYYQESIPPLETSPEPKREIPVPDPTTTYLMQQAPLSGMQQVPVSGMQQGPVSGMHQVPASGMHQVPASGMHQVPASGMQQVQVPGMQHVPASGMQQVPLSGMQQVPVSAPIPESGYAMPSIPAPQQQQQQQQQQFTQYVPVQTYYQVSHPVQQSQPFDHSVPMYYVPVRPNPQPASSVPLHKVAPKPEVQSNLYRPVAPQPLAPQPQMIHMAAAPGPQQGYHVLHHHHHPQAPAPAQPMANYVYYTQTTSAPHSMPGQYQTVISDAAQPTVEMKQNRAS